MVDPNIILQTQTPLQLQQQALGVQQQRQQLQNASLAGVGQDLQNQQQQQNLTDDQNFRQLFTQSLQSGQPISQAAIMQSLGPVKGAAYNKSMLEAQETRSKLQTAKDAHAAAESDWAGAHAHALLQTVGNNNLPDPNALAAAVKEAQGLGYANAANTLSGLATSQDPQAVTRALTQLEQASVKQQNANSQATTAGARKDQAQNTAKHYSAMQGFEAERNRLDAERLANQESAQKNLEAYRTKLLAQGQQRIDNSGNNRAGNGLTAGQNQTVYQKAEQEERKQDAMRQSIGSALQNGLYVKPDGSTVPFESVIPKQGANEDDDAYQARVEKATKGLVAELQNRYKQATAAANAATARKNAAIEAGGVDPDVSTEDAAAARGGASVPGPQQPAPQQPAASQPAKPAAQTAPPSNLVPEGKVVTFSNGQKWTKRNGQLQQLK